MSALSWAPRWATPALEQRPLRPLMRPRLMQGWQPKLRAWHCQECFRPPQAWRCWQKRPRPRCKQKKQSHRPPLSATRSWHCPWPQTNCLTNHRQTTPPCQHPCPVAATPSRQWQCPPKSESPPSSLLTSSSLIHSGVKGSRGLGVKALSSRSSDRQKVSSPQRSAADQATINVGLRKN